MDAKNQSVHFKNICIYSFNEINLGEEKKSEEHVKATSTRIRNWIPMPILEFLYTILFDCSYHNINCEEFTEVKSDRHSVFMLKFNHLLALL